MIFNITNKPEIEELIVAWQQYIITMGDWREVIEGVTPKQTYCGPIYEPTSPLDRPNESFAISDMRSVKVAEPHYHAGGETEAYFVLSGSGLTVVGGEELQIAAGDVIVTSPFNPANNVHVDESNADVKYDHEQFKKLSAV